MTPRVKETANGLVYANRVVHAQPIIGMHISQQYTFILPIISPNCVMENLTNYPASAIYDSI
jgi:hypothetical protein